MHTSMPPDWSWQHQHQLLTNHFHCDTSFTLTHSVLDTTGVGPSLFGSCHSHHQGGWELSRDQGAILEPLVCETWPSWVFCRALQGEVCPNANWTSGAGCNGHIGRTTLHTCEAGTATLQADSPCITRVLCRYAPYQHSEALLRVLQLSTWSALLATLTNWCHQYSSGVRSNNTGVLPCLSTGEAISVDAKVHSWTWLSAASCPVVDQLSGFVVRKRRLIPVQPL